MLNIKKLELLIEKLKNRNNKAFVFFENILNDFKNQAMKSDAIERLSNCFSITQYSNFNQEEEELLKEIISELDAKQ